MKLFACGVCGQPLMFENVRCERCHHRLGYDPDVDQLVALDEAEGLWRSAVPGNTNSYRFCANVVQDACNWLIPAASDAKFCAACVFNRTVPDIGNAHKLALWRELEAAKHRLVYTLRHLGLPMITRAQDPKEGLAFDFLTDEGEQKVLTGHENGIVTLNAKEADVATRVQMRTSMGEAYRTLLGHFRHEIGHYYWDRLVRDDPARLEDCRALLGDERADYQEAMKRHYKNGAPANWGEHFVSAYATMHPWEDFAETFAHFLHIVDSLETARSFGMAVHPGASHELDAETTFDPYKAPSADALLRVWGPICFAVNSLNRGMGQPDLYPFVLAPDVATKLEFIRSLVASAQNEGQEQPRQAA